MTLIRTLILSIQNIWDGPISPLIQFYLQNLNWSPFALWKFAFLWLVSRHHGSPETMLLMLILWYKSWIGGINGSHFFENEAVNGIIINDVRYRKMPNDFFFNETNGLSNSMEP